MSPSLGMYLIFIHAKTYVKARWCSGFNLKFESCSATQIGTGEFYAGV